MSHKSLLFLDMGFSELYRYDIGTMHLLIDGYTADRKLLWDEAIVREFLESYPSKLGMRPISPPNVVTYKGSNESDWGISGVVLIAESHISLHTFPERNYLNVDIFSCKWFDSEKASCEVAKLFRVKGTKSKLIERGIEYLTDEEAEEGMLSERLSLTDDG